MTSLSLATSRGRSRDMLPKRRIFERDPWRIQRERLRDQTYHKPKASLAKVTDPEQSLIWNQSQRKAKWRL